MTTRIEAAGIYDGTTSTKAPGIYPRCLHHGTETVVADVPADVIDRWRAAPGRPAWPGEGWVRHHAPVSEDGVTLVVHRCEHCAADLAAGRPVLVRVGGCSDGTFFLRADALGLAAEGAECAEARRILASVGSPCGGEPHVRGDCRGSARHIGEQERAATRAELAGALTAAAGAVESARAADPARYAVSTYGVARDSRSLAAALACLDSSAVGA